MNANAAAAADATANAAANTATLDQQATLSSDLPPDIADKLARLTALEERVAALEATSPNRGEVKIAAIARRLAGSLMMMMMMMMMILTMMMMIARSDR